MYDSDGKQAFRSLLLELAKRDGLKTYGTFWGTGIDSRLFAAEGFDVTAAEVVRDKHEAMREDAERYGYSAFCGNARRLDQRFDMFHADFCGNASPGNFRTLRAISEMVDRWLAVTLSPDHQLDPSMQGEAASYTVPAWLVGASDFTLEYLVRYLRNDDGQTMWAAVLQRRHGQGNAHRIAPVQIAWSIRQRRDGSSTYWASNRMYTLLRGVLRHKKPLTSWEKSEAVKARYWSDPEGARARAREAYRRLHPNEQLRIRYAIDEDYREAKRAYHREWWAKNKARFMTPERKAQRSEYHRQHYLANRDKYIESARQSRLRKKKAA